MFQINLLERGSSFFMENARCSLIFNPASVLFDGVKTSIKVFKMSIASDYTELTPTLLAMNGKNALLNTINL